MKEEDKPARTRPVGRALSPGRWLALAMVTAALLLAAVWQIARAQPWLGLQWQWSEAAGGMLVQATRGPAQAIPAGTVITALADGAQLLPLQRQDFSIEPASDLPSLSAYDAFLERQDRLARLQAGASLVLVDAQGVHHRIVPASQRPSYAFPADFWVQLSVGLLAWLIASAVWSFRRSDASARCLLLSGASTLVFAPFAAVYSTRELALPAAQFRWLCDLNFLGGAMYCAALVALLWYHPRRLGRLALGPVLVAVYAAWWLVQELRLLDSMLLARRSLVFVALLATAGLAVVQWRRTRADPVARAALQWFLLSWMLGIGLFSMLIFVPQLFGISTAALQGYAFLLFLLVYGGVAFGILRFRLFELGDWWFRAVGWLLLAAVFVLLDVALLMVLAPLPSASIALLVCGVAWLPLRGWLWSRMAGHAGMRHGELFRRVIDVSLAPSATLRQQRGEALLRSLFDPLDIEPGEAVAQPAIAEDGLVLRLPAQGPLGALTLRYPGAGRRLFTPHDLAQARELLEMLTHADASRAAYHRGAMAERGRIARDLHDDVGAQLLSSLHQPDLQRTRETVRGAIAEMRTIVDGLVGERMALGALVAELRHETALRLEVAGITLDWPLPAPAPEVSLDYRAWRNCISMLRELVSNVLRHSGATRVSVSVACEGPWLVSTVQDDGTGIAPGRAHGFGLDNLRRRCAELGGQADITSDGSGTRVRLALALQAEDTAHTTAAPAVAWAAGPFPGRITPQPNAEAQQ